MTEKVFKESDDDNFWGDTDIHHTEGDEKLNQNNKLNLGLDKVKSHHLYK